MATPADKLASTHLYFVCDAPESLDELDLLLEEALLGGAGLIQLRDKGAGEDRLLAAGARFREAADRHDALFLINVRPDLVAPTGADGVHVGQGDVGVAEARRVAGTDAIVGLSSHAPAQLDAAHAAAPDDRPDYLSVGPVWATPTKPGRPAAGLDYVRYAAAHASVPWFAIGGIDTVNIGEVVNAGASRVVVVRAIRDATDPRATAESLNGALGHRVGAAS